MKTTSNWRELKYMIADKLFAYELDEAHAHGIKQGAEFAARTISFQLGLKESTQKLTKTQKIGYDKALAIVQERKEHIRKSTGAAV